MFFAFDTESFTKVQLERLQTCRNANEVRKAFGPDILEIEENKDGTVFIFQSQNKLKRYLELRKSLLSYLLKAGAFDTGREWEQLPSLGSMPEFFASYTGVMALRTSRVQLKSTQPIDPQVHCDVFLTKGDSEYVVEVGMVRPKGDKVDKLFGSEPATPSNIPKEKVDEMERLYRDQLKEPNIELGSDRLRIISLGPKWANSALAKIYKTYFARLQNMTENSEAAIRKQEKEFFGVLGSKYSHWSPFATSWGKSFKDLDEGTRTKILGAIQQVNGWEKNSNFQGAKGLETFLNGATIKGCRVRTSIVVSFLNSDGSQGGLGIDLP